MQETYQRKVTLTGISDIMFDRYAGDNQTELPPEKKMYFGRDGKTLVLPSANIMSFLAAENTESAPKRFLDSRQYKKTAHALLSYTSISPFEIPFTRDGEPIVFDGFDGDSGFYIHRSVARLKGGIPNPKERPTLRTPWELSFTVSVFQNNEFNEDLLNSFFVKGGIAIGLGTFRGVYGKFQVTKWDKA